MALNISDFKRALPRGRHVRRLPVGIGRGLNMGIDFHRGETRLYMGLYEAELNKHLRAIAQPGRRSFDVGGQYGYDALLLAKLTGAEVLSVEADVGLADEILENVSKNPRLARIYVEATYVAATNGEHSRTIDSLAEQYFVPDIIKLDIEGAEVDALLGAERVLTERGPAIQLEVHGDEIEWSCLEILRRSGYPPPTSVVNRRTWLPEHRPIPHNRWLFFDSRA